MLRPAATTRGCSGRAWLAAALLSSLAACVTTYEPVDPANDVESLSFAQPVAIPLPELGGGTNRVMVEFYSGILRRLQDAADDGDVALLDSLVETIQPDQDSGERRARARNCRRILGPLGDLECLLRHG